MSGYPKTWVLVADSARARLFELASAGGELAEQQDWTNPEGRRSERELTSDRPGVSHSAHGEPGGHPMRAGHSAGEAAAEVFARSLAALLKSGLDTQACERVVLVSPPAFLGVLRATLDKQVEKVVAGSVNLDLTRASPAEIRDHLPTLPGLG